MYAFLGFNLKVFAVSFHFFVTKMLKLNVHMEFFYSKTMESFLSIII